jgi:AAA+ ATPase superfamily predicted ATPase
MSFMENQVLGGQSPLYGRRTAQFKVEPFTFSGSLPFLPGFEPRDKAVVYGMTGGIPEYLGRIDNSKPVKQNMIELFLTTSGHSYEEPSNLLKQELREPATYNSLLEAIANGASKLNGISAKTNIESNKCAKYLASLISLGIVRREYPITETCGKRSIYLLNDQMFRFWFRFVFPNISAIAMGLGDKVYESEVEPYLSDFMGHTFEQICRQWIFEQMREDKFPFFTGKVGRWWGNNPKLRKQEEIDILAFREDKAVFCECKWTNAPVGTDVLNELIRRRELFPYTEVWYCVFAKAGFTGGLAAEAEHMGNVRLVQYEEIVGTGGLSAG